VAAAAGARGIPRRRSGAGLHRLRQYHPAGVNALGIGSPTVPLTEPVASTIDTWVKLIGAK